MKIYIVTSGEYSDYGINAVFLDKHEAELYCATHNKKKRWCDCVIEEYETKDGKIKTDREVVYVYKAYPNDYSFIQIKEPVLMFRDEAEKEEPYLDLGLYSRWTSFPVILTKPNKKKALKIAQDKLAELKAKEQGIV